MANQEVVAYCSEKMRSYAHERGYQFTKSGKISVSLLVVRPSVPKKDYFRAVVEFDSISISIKERSTITTSVIDLNDSEWKTFFDTYLNIWIGEVIRHGTNNKVASEPAHGRGQLGQEAKDS